MNQSMVVQAIASLATAISRTVGPSAGGPSSSPTTAKGNVEEPRPAHDQNFGTDDGEDDIRPTESENMM